MRIFDHDVDISYSTRESAEIRNHMATLGVTTMSAESKTEPGGYFSYPQTLEQFHVSDERKAVEVERDLKKLGREPVWKDWDQSFDFKCGTIDKSYFPKSEKKVRRNCRKPKCLL
jgi:2-iminoacetate synthase